MSAVGETRTPWAAPPWLDGVLKGVRVVLMIVGSLAMLAGCFALANVVTSSLAPFLAMLLIFPLAAFATIAIHEGGMRLLQARSAWPCTGCTWGRCSCLRAVAAGGSAGNPCVRATTRAA